MGRPSRWGWAWVVWLGAFLAVEIPAALRRTGTLSSHVWLWFRGPARRSILGAFMVALTAHFVFEASAWWLLTSVPVLAVIVYAVGWGGDAMTREAWDAEWRACFERLRAKGTELLKAQEMARDITAARYGARPAGTPLWLRLALGFITRKLAGLRSVEVSPMWQRVIVAVAYGMGAAAPVVAAALEDGVIASGEWGGVFTAFAIAAWGTFKSNTTIISPNRAVWTPAERVVERVKLDTEADVEAAKALAARTVATAEKKSEKAAEKLGS